MTSAKDLEIQKRIKDATGKTVDIYCGMGHDNLVNIMKDAKKLNVVDRRNNVLRDTDLRYLGNEHDMLDPKNSDIYDQKHLYCKECGEKLTLDDIQHGQLVCANCRNAKKRKSRQNKTDEILVPEPVSSSSEFGSPTFKKVELMNEEQQKKFNEEMMCHVGTIEQLLQHAPDRAIVLVNVGTYSPTINNYYTVPQAER